MPSLRGAQLDTGYCEASSAMVGETQSLSSKSSQGTDNILSGLEGETGWHNVLPVISEHIARKRNQYLAGRQTLNDTVTTLTDGRGSPLLSTLSTEWDDISSTQQKYYTREAREIFAATLSVVPGKKKRYGSHSVENLHWKMKGLLQKTDVFWRQVRLDWCLNWGS